MLLRPSQITLAASFEALPSENAVQRARKALGEQIDAKRAADAARTQFAPLWDLAFWRYLPADPAHTLNSPVASDDDAFSTPEYLKISTRQLDQELEQRERASHDLFR
jgi:hypothetical protein